MSQATRERLFGWSHAFDHPVTLWITLALAAVLVITPVIVLWLVQSHRIDDKMRRELWLRYFTWLVLVPLMEVAPRWSHPVFGCRPRAMLARLGPGATKGVRRALDFRLPACEKAPR